jgi:hypothetical protein
VESLSGVDIRRLIDAIPTLKAAAAPPLSPPSSGGAATK